MQEALKLDFDIVERRIVSFIKEAVKAAEVEGVVVGLSGGLDSSVTSTLCVKALGKERVIILILPDNEVTPKEDIEDAVNLASSLGAEYNVINIYSIFKAYLRSTPIFNEEYRVALGNLKARIRMTLLYYYANVHNLLVAGTGDRSEMLVGYFTKWGDGAADFLPIGSLYKTQVRWLARHLRLPERIINKPSSPRLLKNQLAEEDIGIKYNMLDVILYGLVDLKMKSEELATQLNISLDVINRVETKIEKSEHKRRQLPVASTAE